MATKKANIGDIVEIKTPAGLAYLQYTHPAGTDGELVRVLPGLYATRPSDFVEFARQKELYFIFYFLNHSVRTGRAEVVSNQPIPEWAKPHPLMRHQAAFDEDGRTIRWRIVSAASQLTLEELQRTPLLTHLTPEQERLSIRQIWPHAAMVRELARGWTPERDEEFRLKDRAERLAREAKNPRKKIPENERMSHYLYFPEKSSAEKAAQWFRFQKFSAQVTPSGDGESWLALIKHAPPRNAEEMEKLRDEMEAMAAQLNGEYDGWEIAL